MAKTNKGKSADGHKLGKGKRNKPNIKKDDDAHKFSKSKRGNPNIPKDGKVKTGGTNFKSKQKKFAGKKIKKFAEKAPSIMKDENTEKEDRLSHKKRKLSKEKDNKEADDKASKVAKKADPMITKLMTIYETLRRKNTASEERSKLIDEVLKMCLQKEHDVIHKHGTVRVLEMCVKFGDQTQRTKLFEVFEKNLIELVTSKYAKFLVQKFIEYGSKDQKRKIIESFYGHIKKLIRHKSASSIVDDIYDRYADKAQRKVLAEEFYGPEITIFRAATGSSVEDILKNEPTKKAAVLKHMKEQLDILCQKEVVTHSIIHTVLNNFFKIATDADKMDVISLLKEKVVHILHTKDGASVAMNCVWYSGAKDRKTIIKSFKTFVVKICKEEFGHLVLLSLFDVVDDTVLLKKLLFPELISKLDELLLNMYGRKVILYLLKPRSPQYFTPHVIKTLEEGDTNPHSKKDRSIRGKELCSSVIENLLDVMLNQLKDVLYNKSVAIILLAILDTATGQEKANKVLEEIARIAGKQLKTKSDEENAVEEEEEVQHPICDACGHWVVKRVIQQDKQRAEKDSPVLFSNLLCDAVPEGCFADWASTNRGAFVLVSLMETGIKSVASRVKEDLKFLKASETSKGLDLLKTLL